MYIADFFSKVLRKANFGVLIYLVINIIIMLIAIINPKYLMHDVELMLVAVF